MLRQSDVEEFRW